mmetsp:Transcript_28783/g.56401  ORF Transcript_28783/g.56401 Transcript_28783/m.56401 type:complete len:291 (-) Transcript_28783:391-1263(-)
MKRNSLSTAIIGLVLSLGVSEGFVLNQRRESSSRRVEGHSRWDRRDSAPTILRRRGGSGAGGALEYFEGVPLAPPPDLASAMLHNRIVYLGAGLYPEVTETIVQQLLYLESTDATKPITMYINSDGSTLRYKNAQGQVFPLEANEWDALAVCDVMSYVKPEVQTVCVGKACGTAALLLANGAPGKRFSLPNATIMVGSGRKSVNRDQAEGVMKTVTEILHLKEQLAALLSRRTGQSIENVKQLMSRKVYMSPEEAEDFGLLDSVLTPEKKEEGDFPLLPTLAAVASASGR